MGASFDIGGGVMAGKLVRHPYVRSRYTALMQRWCDAYPDKEALSGLAEEVAREDDEDTAELEVTFFFGR